MLQEAATLQSITDKLYLAIRLAIPDHMVPAAQVHQLAVTALTAPADIVMLAVLADLTAQ